MNYNSNNLNINNLRFDQRNVGHFVKESKSIYTWDFTLNNKIYRVDLEHSKITGKRKVILNGKQLLKRMHYTYNFTFSFHIDKHFLTIVQLSPVSYDLRIDNLGFKGLIYNMYRQREVSQDNNAANTSTQLKRNDDAFFASENTFEFGDNTTKQQVTNNMQFDFDCNDKQQQVDINGFEFCT